MSSSILDQPARRLLAGPGRANLNRVLTTVATFGGGDYVSVLGRFAEGVIGPGGTVRHVLESVDVKQLDVIAEEVHVLETRDEALRQLDQHATKLLAVGAIPTGVSSARSVGETANAVIGVSVNGQVDNPGALTVEPELTNRFVRVKQLTSLYSGPEGWASFVHANAEAARSGHDLLAQFAIPARAAQATGLVKAHQAELVRIAREPVAPAERVKTLESASREE